MVAVLGAVVVGIGIPAAETHIAQGLVETLIVALLVESRV